MVKKFNSLKTLSKFVAFSIFVVIIYAIMEFISAIVFQVSHETLTTCIFTLFGTELATCGFIKIFKLKEV